MDHVGPHSEEELVSRQLIDHFLKGHDDQVKQSMVGSVSWQIMDPERALSNNHAQYPDQPLPHYSNEIIHQLLARYHDGLIKRLQSSEEKPLEDIIRRFIEFELQQPILLDALTLIAAQTITETDDLNSIIFRRFDTLAIQNILALYGELSDIERKGQDLSPGVQVITPMQTRQAKIKQYHEAVILYSKMLQLSKPPPGYVRDLNKALEDKCVHHVWNVLNPRTNNPFTDVVAVSPFDDPLTRFIAASPLSIFFVGWIESFKRKKLLVNINVLRRFVTVVQFVVSLGFVVSALWALWKLGNDIYKKLWVVTGFVAGFSIWVGFLTGLTKNQSITATATYAAVLVVYVGSLGTGPN
ncbi:hypothetical protein GGS24DRAFT_497615 [Hypoxylon argillaceum]|nr:hypothetical protein GGS24DRAFT_497615 [Hypoxylon argillaceum]